MKNFKIALAICIFMTLTLESYADSIQLQGGAEKINCKQIAPTNFSNQLKKSSGYKIPNYNMPASSNMSQDPMVNAMMGGMMNSMMMGQGVMDNTYSNMTIQRQQQEYVKQQMEYAGNNDSRDEASNGTQRKEQPETNENGWF